MTLREHLEANEQLLGFALNAADVAAPQTLEEAIKQARKHAVEALAILDAATVPKHGKWVAHLNYRLVSDPNSTSGASRPVPENKHGGQQCPPSPSSEKPASMTIATPTAQTVRVRRVGRGA